MRKTAGIVLLTVGILATSSLAGTLASADTTIRYKSANVLRNISDANISVTDLEGREVELSGGPHGGTGAKSIFVDSVIGSTQTAKLVDKSGNGVIGYVTVDAGEEFIVNKVLVDIVHDWGAQDFFVELSLTADFNNPITVYNNKAEEQFTSDSSVAVTGVLYNIANQGRTFEFSPVKARYIRVTGNTVGNGTAQGYTCLGEIQMFAVMDGNPVYADMISGKYTEKKQVTLSCDVAGTEIYYTMDGGVPTKKSNKYAEPIGIGADAVRLRAVSYKDGKYGMPFDFNYLSDSPVFTEPENICFGKTGKFLSMDMSRELDVEGFNGSAADKANLTDNSFDPGSSALNTKEVGWAVVDFGKEAYVDKVVFSMWHDWWFGDVKIELARREDFSDRVTVLEAESMQNVATTGKTIEFASTLARYIRITNNTKGEGKFSLFTELQAWTCAPPEEFTGSENACLNKNVTAYDSMGTPKEAQDHNGGKTIAAVVDGRTDAENSIQFDGCAFIQVDMEKSVWINKVVLNLWHDWVFRSVTVQVSDDPAFETGVQTIFCSDGGNWNGLSAYKGSMDPAHNYNVEWIPNASVGFTFNFEPIKGRYIRAFAQTGQGSYNSIYTELQAWTCRDPAAPPAYEYKSYVSSVPEVENVAVYCNKNFAELALPSVLNVVYSDGTNKEIACVWTSEDYDKTKAGEYTAFCCAADESDYYGLLKSISVKILVTAVNTTMLDAAITEAEAVTISNYTTSTINVFTAAKNAAEAVKQQAYITQEEVDGACTALKAAYGALALKGDTAALKALFDSVKEYSENDYTVSSFETFGSARSAAEAAVAADGNADLDQAAVDGLLAALTDAKESLKARAVTADYNALKEAETALKAKIADEIKITVSSLAQMKEHLGSAAEYLEATEEAKQNISADEIKELTKILFEAQPVLRGSIAGLKEYFDACKQAYGFSETDTNGYFIGSYADYLDRMYEAEALFAPDIVADMSQAEIDVYYDALKAKVDALVKQADRTAFDAAVEKAKAAKEAEYTVSSYKNLQTVYREITATYEKAPEQLLQEEVDGALEKINAALSALEKKGDKAVLNEYLALYSGEDANDYTKKSFGGFSAALYEANKAKRSDDVSQPDVDAAAAALKAAYEKLERLGDKTELTQMLADAKKIDATKLDEMKASDLKKAIDYVQALVDFDGEITQTQVTEAENLLKIAVENSKVTEGGCKSVIGFTAVGTLLCFAAAVCMIRKKRCDNAKN